MRPHCDRDDQIELFADFIPEVCPAPKLGLPIQKSNTIDSRRAAAILHVSLRTVLRMCERALLRSYCYNRGKKIWQIEYTSIVEYCDSLRVRYGISDSRAQLPPGHKRRRDEDLLPFPFLQTIFVADAMKRLECSGTVVLQLIESGDLVAYKFLTDNVLGHWRIHEPSLDRYIARLHATLRP